LYYLLLFSICLSFFVVCVVYASFTNLIHALSFSLAQHKKKNMRSLVTGLVLAAALVSPRANGEMTYENAHAQKTQLRSNVRVRAAKPSAMSRIIVDGGMGITSEAPAALTFDLFSDARGEEDGIMKFETKPGSNGNLYMTRFTEEVLTIVVKDPAAHAAEKRAHARGAKAGVGLPDHLDVTSANHSTNEGAIGKHFADRSHVHLQAAAQGSAPYATADVYGDPILAERVDVKGKLSVPHGIFQVVASGDVTVAKEAQWKLAVAESFEKVVDGWHHSAGAPANKRNSCAKGLVERLNGDFFLGFYKSGFITKTFEIPPDHTKARIRANFHFFDMWEGQVAQMKVNGAVVWQRAHRTCNTFSIIPEVAGVCTMKGVNACGGDDPDTMGHVIEHTLSYFTPKLELSFGIVSADGEAAPTTGSFGVDDVEIYVS
jgi:hypothetical protein